jgi:hypothetical protein
VRRSTGVVLTAIIAVAAGVMLIVFVVNQSSKPGTDINLGTHVFQVGKAAPLAKEIAQRGPVLNQALTSGGPDIYVQHVGADPLAGWHAFDAQAAGQPRRCTLVWQAGSSQFRDPCNGQLFPADGTGLRSYRMAVTDGQLTIDFRAPGD